MRQESRNSPRTVFGSGSAETTKFTAILVRASGSTQGKTFSKIRRPILGLAKSAKAYLAITYAECAVQTQQRGGVMIVCWWLQEPRDGVRHLEAEKELRPTQRSLATAVTEPAARVNRQNQRKSTRKGTVFAVLDHDAGKVADLCRLYNLKRWCLLLSARHDMKAK